MDTHELSVPSLARFRTKFCERIIAKNFCCFGDSCLYSHTTEWIRRNPLKTKYAPILCSRRSTCCFGKQCKEAHSLEEVLYHPTMYKTRACRENICLGYYCPFIHTHNTSTFETSMHTIEHKCWCLIDTLWEVQLEPHASDAPWPLGGRVLCARNHEGATFRIRAVEVDRSKETIQVTKELKKTAKNLSWIAVHRTVSSLYVVLPEMCCSTLENFTPSGGNRVLTWGMQLVSQVLFLHSYNITHLCIAPTNLYVHQDGLSLCDFSGKIRALQHINNYHTLGEDWLVWYPPEVHQAREVNLYLIDAWQVGVALYYIMTGSHPFGKASDIQSLCAAIQREEPNLYPIRHSVFYKIIKDLLQSDPEKRALLSNLNI